MGASRLLPSTPSFLPGADPAEAGGRRALEGRLWPGEGFADDGTLAGFDEESAEGMRDGSGVASEGFTGWAAGEKCNVVCQ